MKKEFLILTFFMLAVVNLNAQKLKSGNISVLKNETTVAITMDYSKMVFAGFVESDYTATLNAAQKTQWEQAKKEFFTTFVSYLNTTLIAKKSDLICVANSVDTKYKFTVVPLVFDANYNMRAEIILSEQGSNTAIAVISISGYAYRFGTQIHKAKGAFKTAGIGFAEFLAKKI